MQYLTLITFLICLVQVTSAQDLVNQTEDIQPPVQYENIHVHKMYSDQHASSYLIWVKEGVKAHKHEHHTENLYVLEGNASMKLGEQAMEIKPGDHIIIPENTIHSVKVTGNAPLKVISIQSPEFFGKDRVFID